MFKYPYLYAQLGPRWALVCSGPYTKEKKKKAWQR